MSGTEQTTEKNNPFVFNHFQTAIKCLILVGSFLSIFFVYYFAFFGTDITDEAFYIADALEALHGNLPYALNNQFVGIGFTFAEIPFLFLYRLFVPGCEGVVLFSRLCFLSLKLLGLAAVFLVLRRKVAPCYLLLYLTCFFTYSGVIQNFSYNTVPPVLITLAGALAYVSVEGEGMERLSLFASGFLCCMTVFSNPVYVASALLLLLLVCFRSAADRRAENTRFFSLGALAQLLLVFVPLLAQAGFHGLWTGLSSMLRNTFSTKLFSSLGTLEKLENMLRISKDYLFIVSASILLWLVLRLMLKKYADSAAPRRAVNFSMALCIFVCLCIQIAKNDRWNSIYKIGLLTVALLLPFMLGLKKKSILLLYIGISPVFCVFLTIFASSSSSILSRFGTAMFSLYALLLLLMEDEWQPIRYLAVLCAALCIFLQGYTMYKAPYRDANFRALTTRVDSGVYKGLYTTPQRAHDLPELEEYLNARTAADEYFAFRDNVPCGYLMMHRGKVCDISSWDCFQYTYYRNTPTGLFDYYKRRGAIPDVIFYVDYGRDQQMSIDDESFCYNEFVRAYYDLESDVSLNGTFKRVMVFRYAGGFDGEYDLWVNRFGRGAS